MLQNIPVFRTEGQVKLIWCQELAESMSDIHRMKIKRGCPYSREGIDGVPVAVPVVHDDSLGRNPRNAEFLRDLHRKVVKARSAVRRCDVECTFLLRSL